MDIADCYRLLQLTSRANAKDLKTSYRRLARQWHPDTNPGDALAHEKFIQVTEAYKILQKIIPATGAAPSSPSPKPSVARSSAYSAPAQAQPAAKNQVRTAPPQSKTPSQTNRGTASYNPTPAQTQRQPPKQPPTSTSSGSQASSLSPAEIKLKIDSYKQLQELIQKQRFPRAVALIEALAQRLPQDPEVRQWQAIIYQSWGRQLIRERKLNQARAYLKKALNTDPHNKSLWAEIEQDFKKLEMVI